MATGHHPIVALLGAGASRDAGIPTTVGMTEQVISRMQNPLHMRGIEFIHHTLAADMAARNPEGGLPLGFGQQLEVERSSVDVERLFASIELLIDRFDQPWSPFVSAWSPGLDSFSTGPALRESDLARALQAAAGAFDSLKVDSRGKVQSSSGRPVGRTIVQALAQGIVRATAKGQPRDVSSLLSDIRDEMLRSLFDVLSFDAEATSYLGPLGDLADVQGSLTLGTLNYDRTVEEMCARSGRHCDTGIDTWLKGEELVWSSTGVRLLKLHGSIDWAIDDQRTEVGLPFQKIVKLDPAGPTGPATRPAVVFGEAGKLRSEGPYLELLLAFANELKGAETLLVIGYSFRDQHINEVIGRWFSAADSRRMVVLDPADLGRTWESFAGHVSRLRSTLVPQGRGERAPGRVAHVRASAAEGFERALALARSPDPFPLPDD